MADFTTSDYFDLAEKADAMLQTELDMYALEAGKRPEISISPAVVRIVLTTLQENYYMANKPQQQPKAPARKPVAKPGPARKPVAKPGPTPKPEPDRAPEKLHTYIVQGSEYRALLEQLDSGDVTYRSIDADQRKKMVLDVIRLGGKDCTMADFDSVRPTWMPTASAQHQAFGSWTELQKEAFGEDAPESFPAHSGNGDGS